MTQGLRIALAVLVIVILVAVFIVTFILYKRTPPPKGCEDIHPSAEKCHGCKETSCHFNLYYNDPDDEMKPETKNENKENENK